MPPSKNKKKHSVKDKKLQKKVRTVRKAKDAHAKAKNKKKIIKEEEDLLPPLEAAIDAISLPTITFHLDVERAREGHAHPLTPREISTVTKSYEAQVPHEVQQQKETVGLDIAKYATLSSIPETDYMKLFSRLTKSVLKADKKETVSFQKYAALHQEKHCELILARDKKVDAVRLISFLAVNTKEKRTMIVCFDVVELRQAALDDWPNQGGPAKIKQEAQLLVPNLAKLYLPKDLQEALHYHASHFSAEESKRIHKHFADYSDFLLNQDRESRTQLTYLIDFWIAPLFKSALSKIPALFDYVFGKEFVAKASAVLFPAAWLAQQGWSLVKKAGKYPVKLLRAILDKLWSNAYVYARFIQNNPLFINLALYLFSVGRILICVYFMGPKVGIESIKVWLESQRIYKETSQWVKNMILILETVVNCPHSVATFSFFDFLNYCVWNSLQIVWEVTLGPLWSVLNWVGIVSDKVRPYITPNFLDSVEQIRKRGLELLSLDWSVVVKALPIFVPKVLRLLAGFLRLPPQVYQGLELAGNYVQIYMAFSGILEFVTDGLRTVWECLNLSGNCCFPKFLKMQYEKVSKQEESQLRKDLEVYNKSWFTWSPMTLDQFRIYQKDLASDSINKLSDDRAKVLLGWSGATVCGLRINQYVMSPNFFRKIQRYQKVHRALPRWLQNLYQTTYFQQNGSVFYSVSAQELQRHYPRAVGEFKTRTLSFLYIIPEQLPLSLQEALVDMNHNLFSSSLSVKASEGMVELYG